MHLQQEWGRTRPKLLCCHAKNVMLSCYCYSDTKTVVLCGGKSYLHDYPTVFAEKHDSSVIPAVVLHPIINGGRWEGGRTNRIEMHSDTSYN